MAACAIVIEVGQDVIRILLAHEHGLMARIAIFRCARESARMASIAGHGDMFPGQREGGLIVVKGSGRPPRRRVTR